MANRKPKKTGYEALDFEMDNLDALHENMYDGVAMFLEELQRGMKNVLKAIEKGDQAFAKGHLETLVFEIEHFMECEECDDENEE